MISRILYTFLRMQYLKIQENVSLTFPKTFICQSRLFVLLAQYVGRSRGLPENPKSMGWEIHGVGNSWKSMNKSRIFGNPDLTKKSRFENELVVFFAFF